jgi:hypothetical protein
MSAPALIGGLDEHARRRPMTSFAGLPPNDVTSSLRARSRQGAPPNKRHARRRFDINTGKLGIIIA